jgi:hypothetical protein
MKDANISSTMEDSAHRNKFPFPKNDEEGQIDGQEKTAMPEYVGKGNRTSL